MIKPRLSSDKTGFHSLQWKAFAEGVRQCRITERRKACKVSPKERSKHHHQVSVSNNWSLHSNFKRGETTEASTIWSRQTIVAVSTAQGGETIEETLIASKQVTAGVSTKQGGETTEASPIWSKQVTVWVSTAHGGVTIEASSIHSKQATVGVSIAQGGETIEERNRVKVLVVRWYSFQTALHLCSPTSFPIPKWRSGWRAGYNTGTRYTNIHCSKVQVKCSLGTMWGVMWGSDTSTIWHRECMAQLW